MSLEPLIITVAPNGARKTKADHPALPITPDELAEEAYNCMVAGAAMIHLHVRDENDGHTLDVGRYREAMAAVEEKCGDGLVVQVTTEAVGIYEAAEQMRVVRELNPQSASLAIREFIVDGNENEAKDFFHEIAENGTLAHYILYDAEDVVRFNKFRNDGVLPDHTAFQLFVLGRYTKNQTSSPADILPFLDVKEERDAWSVCAFGPLENAAAAAAVALGGHVRVGFENNIRLKDGSIASNNASLVHQVKEVSEAIGRPLARASDLRKVLSSSNL